MAPEVLYSFNLYKINSRTVKCVFEVNMSLMAMVPGSQVHDLANNQDHLPCGEVLDTRTKP